MNVILLKITKVKLVPWEDELCVLCDCFLDTPRYFMDLRREETVNSIWKYNFNI